MMTNIIKRKIKTVISNPKTVLIKILLALSPLFSDKLYLKLLFPLRTGYKLDLENPQTYNQKLQWLKLNYRKPELTRMVDKYAAKQYAKKIIGEEFIIKTYGVWNTFEEIDFEHLPNQFVLKTTHDQGGIIICNDKVNFDYLKAKKKMNKHLKRKHYYLSREWPYKNVIPRIIAEELLVDEGKGDLWDYKFYCFQGEPKIMLFATERYFKDVKFNYYDMDFNLLELKQGSERSVRKLDKPIGFDKMKELSKLLSETHPHVRIDFYNINGKIYFGEFTFFDSGGMAIFQPREWDYTFGNWINLTTSEEAKERK